jgi:hypothetical protein
LLLFESFISICFQGRVAARFRRGGYNSAFAAVDGGQARQRDGQQAGS